MTMSILRFFRLCAIVGPLPIQLTNGTVADATQVMADMQFIADQVNQNSPSGGGNVSRGTNLLSNGAMQVAQRFVDLAVLLPAASIYTLDRWQGKTGVGGSAEYSRVADGSLPSFEYFCRVQRTAANAATTLIQLAQSLETVDSYPLQGQTVTVSFYARNGANYSAGNAFLNCTLYTGTGSDENVLAGYTGAAATLTDNAVLTSGWTRYQVSGTIPSSATECGVVFTYTPTGTAGAADYFDVTGVQLEIGAAASLFDFQPFAHALARCQRYFQKSFNFVVPPATGSGSGVGTLSYWQALQAGAKAQLLPILMMGPMRGGTASGSNISGAAFNPVNNNQQAHNNTTGIDCSSTTVTAFEHTGYIQTTLDAGASVGDQLLCGWTLDAEL